MTTVIQTATAHTIEVDGDGVALDVAVTHLADTADAHDASAISFTPTGTIAATDTQAAVAEVATDAAAALAAEAALARNGDNITSGTVADARIASTIARNSEVAAAYQPLDADLTTLASNITAFGQSLVDDVDAATARTTLDVPQLGQVYTSEVATGTNAAGYGNLGDNVTAVGYLTGQSNPGTGDGLTAVGAQAAQTLVTPGTYNTMIGMLAGFGAANHSQSTLIGALAGYQADLGSSSQMTAVGYAAGYLGVTLASTLIGAEAGGNASGTNLTAVGQLAGNGNAGSYVTALGHGAAQSNTADSATAIGWQAGYQNSGTAFVGLGYRAGFQNTHNSVVLLGREAAAAAANEMVVGSASYAANRWIPGHDPDTYFDFGTADTLKIYAGAQKVLEINETGGAPYLGFFGTAAVAKPTGVAVTAEGIHAALVTLGLISA